MANALLQARQGSREYINGQHSIAFTSPQIQCHHTSPPILTRSYPGFPRLSSVSAQRGRFM